MVLSNEKMLKLMEAVGNWMANYIEQNSPVKIGFMTETVRFDFGHADNTGIMRVTYEHPSLLRLSVGVYRNGTDRLYSNFLPKAESGEMIRYLKDPASHAQWAEQVIHLSGSVDEYWD